MLFTCSLEFEFFWGPLFGDALPLFGDALLELRHLQVVLGFSIVFVVVAC